MAWGREPSKQDILRLAIVAMIKAEVPSVEDDCAGWSLSNEDFKFKLKGTYGRGDSKVRVSVSLRGLSFPHDTPPPRDPFFVASTVEDAKEKLNNKLLPAAKALREQCIEARGARAVRVARIREEYARVQKLFDGIPNVEVSPSYSGSITIKTKAGIDVSITNYKGFWQMTLHAPVVTNPEAALDLVKLLNGGGL